MKTVLICSLPVLVFLIGGVLDDLTAIALKRRRK
jgi:hypothetical protein